MREVQILNIDGNSDVFQCYEEFEFPWLNMPDARRKTRMRKHPEYYLNMFATFDIETTTIIPDDPEKHPYGFMYHWQMDIGGVIAYGRTWDEFIYLMNKIVDWLEVDYDNRLVIYVHNLSFEFEFMKDYLSKHFGGIEIFASKSRKIMKCTCGNGLEFRCSYFLTNMSLLKASQNEKGVKHIKAAGDLDYKKLRTKSTYLDDVEFGYCIADVVSLYEIIKNRLKNYGDTLDSIPITSTGYPRRDCRKACRRQVKYREKYFKKCAIRKDTYILLTQAGRGGNTHANRHFSGRFMYGVDSFDIESSYPTQILLEDGFPIGKWSIYGDVNSIDELQGLLDEYCCLFTITLFNPEVRDYVPMPYIPYSKIYGDMGAHYGSLELDNGRLLSCKNDDNNAFVTLTITDVDYYIIKKQYKWDSIAIGNMQICKRGPLPEAIRSQVFEYYKKKCILKEDIKKLEYKKANDNFSESDANKLDDLKYLYGKTKNLLNGIFGMMYTNPVRPEITYDENTGEFNEVFPDISEALEKYAKGRNNFLIYSWGVYITAFARRSLEDLLDAFTIKEESGAIYSNVYYCDTDSAKGILTDYTRQKIKELNENIIKRCIDKGIHVDVDSDIFYIGRYEHETEYENYKRFISFGAKKYAYEDSDGLHITISGVKKKEGAKELKKIENFAPGFVFKNSAGSTLYYNDDTIHEITINGDTFTTASNIGIVDSTYEIGITDEYAQCIGYGGFYEE